MLEGAHKRRPPTLRAVGATPRVAPTSSLGRHESTVVAFHDAPIPSNCLKRASSARLGERSASNKETIMEPSTQSPRYAQLFIEGLQEANVTVAAAVPESPLAGVYRMCAKDNAIRYIPVTNEAELPGICAGTYLVGKKGLRATAGLRADCPLCLLPRHAAGHGHELSRRMGRAQLVGPQSCANHGAHPQRAAHSVPLHRSARRHQAGDQKSLPSRRFEQLAGRHGVHRRRCRPMQRIAEIQKA